MFNVKLNMKTVVTFAQDGETSLKTKVAPPMTKELKSVDSLSNFCGFVECENPNPKLDSFLGRMTRMETTLKKVIV